MEKLIKKWRVELYNYDVRVLDIIQIDDEFYVKVGWDEWLGRCPNPYCPDPWVKGRCNCSPDVWIYFYNDFYNDYCDPIGYWMADNSFIEEIKEEIIEEPIYLKALIE